MNEQSKLDKRVEEEALKARVAWHTTGRAEMPAWVDAPGSVKDQWLDAVRPLVERIAELEDAGRATAENLRRCEIERNTTRAELETERQARRAAAGRISEQAAQIAALEQRVGDADEEIRALGEHAADLARVAEGREATIATLRAHLADAEGGMRTALRMAERPAGERVS